MCTQKSTQNRLRILWRIPELATPKFVFFGHHHHDRFDGAYFSAARDVLLRTSRYNNLPCTLLCIVNV